MSREKFTTFSLLLLLFGLLPARGYAEGMGIEPDAYGSVFLGLSLVVVAYFFSYLLYKWLIARHGFVSGAPFVLLGLLLVPWTGWLEITLNFQPLVLIASAAVALQVGLGMGRKRLVTEGAGIMSFLFVVTAVTVFFVVVLPLLALDLWADEATQEFWIIGILALGAMALVAEGRQLDAIADYFGVEGESLELARKVTWWSTVIAALFFGLVIAFFQPTWVFFDDARNGAILVGAHLVLGGVIGAIGGALLEERPEDDRALTILIGLVITLAATAYLTPLSVVFLSVVAGLTMINISSEAIRMRQMVDSAHVPLYILLLFAVGTLWSPTMGLTGLLMVAIYLGLRFLGRLLGIYLFRPRLTGHRPDPGIHRALWAPGALTAAMIVDMVSTFGTDGVMALILSAFILILVAEEVVSFVLVRGWMIDISDAGPSRRRTSPWGDWGGKQ